MGSFAFKTKTFKKNQYLEKFLLSVFLYVIYFLIIITTYLDKRNKLEFVRTYLQHPLHYTARFRVSFYLRLSVHLCFFAAVLLVLLCSVYSLQYNSTVLY